MLGLFKGRSTGRHRRRHSGRVLACIVLIALGCSHAAADGGHDGDDDEDDDRNWMLLIGAGTGLSPSFSGSDRREIEYFPFIIGAYEWSRTALSIEGDEIAFSYLPDLGLPLRLSAGLTLGESRREDDDSALSGSNDVDNIVRGIGRLTIGEDVITGNAQVRYVPLSVDGDPVEHAFLYDLFLESELKLIPFMIRSTAGISLMDGTYAQAMYDTDANAPDGAYRADAGLHSVDASLEVILMFAPFAGIYLGGELSWLQGSAAESPVSELDVQSAGRLALFYMF